MNKIYKLVWSKVRNTWVVASEIANGHGKSSSRRKKTMAALMVFSLLSAGGLTYAEPNLTSDQQAVYEAVLQKLETEKKTAHYFSVNSTDKDADSNYNNDGATGRNAVAIGIKAKAQGRFSTALGREAVAEGIGSTALGYSVKAKGFSSMALGREAVAEGVGSTALGYYANARAYLSLALGYGSSTEGSYSVALGNKVKALVEGSVALGEGAVADREARTVGYIALGGSATFEDALKTLNKREDYAKWTATINASKAEYDRLTKAYFDASDSDKAAKKAELDTWKGQHADFIEALTAKEKLEATWQATKAAVSVGSDSLDEAGNKIITSRQITGVAAGTEDTDAVNVAQLKKVAAMAKSATVNIAAGDNVTVSKDANTGKYTISATDTTLKTGTNALSISNGQLKLSMEDTKGNKVTGSVDLDSIQGAVGTGKTYTMTGTEDSTNNTTTIALKDNKGNEQKVTVATKDTNTYTTKATYDAGSRKLTFTRNDNTTYGVDLSGIAGSITGDTRNTIAESATIGVDSTSKNADGSINYKLNVKTEGKVEKDNKGIVSGGTVYKETRIEKDGKYVKKDNTAGKNLSALDKQVGINTEKIQRLGSMENRIGELGTRVDKVGAGAAALAGLHPMDYDPDNKFDVAAGYGHYKGANALAIGAFYRPDENKMISIGGSFGGGENMISAGISVKVGQGTGISTSKAAMANEIRELKARDREREAQMQEIMRQLEILQKQAGK